MKLGLIGDVHGNVTWAVSAMQYAKDNGAERIVFLGDFGYSFRPAFVDALAEASIETDMYVEWIDGNHEDFNHLTNIKFDLGERFIYHQRGSIQKIDDTRVMFLGGATSVDRQWRVPYREWWPQEALTFMDVARANDFGLADIVLSHDAPYLPPMLDDDTAPFPKIDLEISDLHRTIYRKIYSGAQPKAVFHGHYHVFYRKRHAEPWGEVDVHGLNCDGTSLFENVVVIDTEDFK